MEIFSEEFKNLLSTQLEELTDVVKTKKSKENQQEMSDYEIAKEIADCMDNSDCSKKEKKKKNKKFKVGDVVYWGEKKGVVKEQFNNISESSTFVCFEETGEFTNFVCFEETGEFTKRNISFTKDGRFLFGSPIVLSHFPYELKMKKIK